MFDGQQQAAEYQPAGATAVEVSDWTLSLVRVQATGRGKELIVTVINTNATRRHCTSARAVYQILNCPIEPLLKRAREAAKSAKPRGNIRLKV